jgi:hypothetical protein
MIDSSSNVDDLLLQATCSISIDGKLRGTGWLIDARGYILTVGHVLGTQQPTETCQVAFAESDAIPARLVNWAFDNARGVDCAVLQIDPPAGRTALPILLTRSLSGDAKIFGFGKTLKDLSSGLGRYIGPVLPDNRYANRLFSLQTVQTNEGGYSGAAIYSEDMRAVVGIQTERVDVAGYAAQGSTILAMPLYRIAEQFPDLAVFSNASDPSQANLYSYHVYLSYEREGIQETWVEQFFKDELSDWLKLELGSGSVSVFFDHNSRRKPWGEVIRQDVRRALCIVPILTASYWRSQECLAELESFRAREKDEQVAMVQGILFHERGACPADINIPVLDFTAHARVFEGFRSSAKYGDFQDQVQCLAKKLADLIKNAPERFEDRWPVRDPQQMVRPVEYRDLRIERPEL